MALADDDERGVSPPRSYLSHASALRQHCHVAADLHQLPINNLLVDGVGVGSTTRSTLLPIGEEHDDLFAVAHLDRQFRRSDVHQFGHYQTSLAMHGREI